MSNDQGFRAPFWFHRALAIPRSPSTEANPSVIGCSQSGNQALAAIAAAAREPFPLTAALVQPPVLGALVLLRLALALGGVGIQQRSQPAHLALPLPKL